MKKVDLQKLGLQELNKSEQATTNGGIAWFIGFAVAGMFSAIWVDSRNRSKR